ncbi:MAG: hypothetical protein V5A64_06100 [Candidatus Thermoplasmatota archaeon]
MKNKKKTILFGSVLAAFLILMMPAINIVNAQNFLTTEEKTIHKHSKKHIKNK